MLGHSSQIEYSLALNPYNQVLLYCSVILKCRSPQRKSPEGFLSISVRLTCCSEPLSVLPILKATADAEHAKKKGERAKTFRSQKYRNNFQGSDNFTATLRFNTAHIEDCHRCCRALEGSVGF